MLEAVLFDWGDTLMRVDWNDDVALEGSRVGLAALGEAGFVTAEAVHAYFLERANDLFQPGAIDEVDLVAITSGCFSHLGVDLSEEQLARYMEASHEHWAGRSTLAPTTHELLETLRRRGLKLGIVSNTAIPRRLLAPILERQGLIDRLDVAVFSSEVGKRKPHPAIFERALAALDVAPQDALFVGDRLYEDVRGAGELGMTTVQALWFRADEHPDGGRPDFQAFTQMDVVNVVRRLSGEL